MPDEDVQNEGVKALEEAWWEAIGELRDIVMSAENPEHRINAAGALLTYCTSLNVGISEPFIPAIRWDPDADKDSDGDDD